MAMAVRWIERRFERMIWKFQLISIIPVVLSLLGERRLLRDRGD